MAFEKGPANFYFAPFRIKIPIARTADDAPGLAIDDCECAAGLERAVEISLEHGARVSIVFRMLLPNHGIARRAKERIEVRRLKRSQLEKFADQRRLQIEIQVAAVHRTAISERSRA